MQPMRQFVCTIRVRLPGGLLPNIEGFKALNMQLIGYSEEELSPPPAVPSTQFIAPGGFNVEEFGKF